MRGAVGAEEHGAPGAGAGVGEEGGAGDGDGVVPSVGEG